MSKIYTRFGDQGQTMMLGGITTTKHHPLIHMLGDLDEVNSFLGLVATSSSAEHSSPLGREQSRLLTIGGAIAGDKSCRTDMVKNASNWVAELEADIDGMTQELPALKNFLLPGGHPGAAAAHVARSVCRRAERRFFELVTDDQPLQDSVGPYLNRLADWLFTLARSINQSSGTAEPLWQSPRNRRDRSADSSRGTGKSAEM